jgi:DNA-binding Lrp family transcriptional regulator
VKNNILTKNEQKVLYGITKYPELNDSQLSNIIDVKLSTLTSIKKRLYDQGFYKNIVVPLLNNLGCELFAVLYTRFNPVVPLKDRVKTTQKTIEVFEEIFYSLGEQEKGFSLSFSSNYTNIGRINEIRTDTFGKVGLLEDEYPNEIIFPFEISNIRRFFDYARILKKSFGLDELHDLPDTYQWFKSIQNFSLSEKEKKVFLELIKYPDLTPQQIGENIGLSRHTVSRIKNKFFEYDLIKKITIPNMYKLGFEILAFYPIKFNPSKSPKNKDIDVLDTSSTVFLAHRMFETIIISAYPTYQDYKEDKMNKIRYLKENDLIMYAPSVGKYLFERMVTIKDIDFISIINKILYNRNYGENIQKILIPK